MLRPARTAQLLWPVAGGDAKCTLEWTSMTWAPHERGLKLITTLTRRLKEKRPSRNQEHHLPFAAYEEILSEAAADYSEEDEE